MSYVITVNGREVRCETPEDLRKLLEQDWLEEVEEGRYMSQGGARRAGPRRLPGYRQKERDRFESMIAAMSALLDSGKDGLSPEKMALMGGLDDPHSMSGVMRGWTARLEQLGFSREDVFRHETVGHSGVKAWFPGPKLKAAIKACQKAVAEV